MNQIIELHFFARFGIYEKPKQVKNRQKWNSAGSGAGVDKQKNKTKSKNSKRRKKQKQENKSKAPTAGVCLLYIYAHTYVHSQLVCYKTMYTSILCVEISLLLLFNFYCMLYVRSAESWDRMDLGRSYPYFFFL